MCLIVFAFDPDAEQKLLVLANRDEFYERKSSQAAFWPDRSGVLAGRDDVAGGTWLGVHSSGRFAAVTNYREPGQTRADAKSRGELPVDFLTSGLGTLDYLSTISDRQEEFNGFNLIVYDGLNLGYLSNRSDEGPMQLGKGIYGISNHLLDTPWPKVVEAKKRLSESLETASHPNSIWADSSFLNILGDESLAPDPDLPSTGVSLEWERILSAMTIRSAHYGTRCSTMVGMMQNGVIRFKEKTIEPQGLQPDTVQFEIQPAEAY